MTNIKPKSRFSHYIKEKKAIIIKIIFLFTLILCIALGMFFIMSEKTNRYPLEFSRNFLDSCLQNNGTKKGCECALKYLQDNYSYEEVQQFDQQALKDNNTIPDAISNSFTNCYK
ncbi:MAG TPA: hypothetical protein PKB09_01095 [Candidatus Saccharibacteria bacterium]|nr:hypothetical protein [Candidatus Saccharibacteria bacterium]